MPADKDRVGFQMGNDPDMCYRQVKALKKVMDAFIKEGLIQNLFAEGSFNTRLEYVDQFPKGSVIWYFDRTDMTKAKKSTTALT
jgi:hypothetical protein